MTKPRIIVTCASGKTGGVVGTLTGERIFLNLGAHDGVEAGSLGKVVIERLDADSSARGARLANLEIKSEWRVTGS